MWIFTLKEDQRTSLKALLSRQHCFALPPTGLITLLQCDRQAVCPIIFPSLSNHFCQLFTSWIREIYPKRLGVPVFICVRAPVWGIRKKCLHFTLAAVYLGQIMSDGTQTVSHVRLLTLFFCIAGRQAESDRVQRPSLLPCLYEQFVQKFLKKSVVICSALVYLKKKSQENPFFCSEGMIFSFLTDSFLGVSSPALFHGFSALPLLCSSVSSCLMSLSLLQCYALLQYFSSSGPLFSHLAAFSSQNLSLQHLT